MMGETKKDRIQLLVRRFFLFLTDTFLLNACVYLSLIMRFDVGIVSIEPQYISNYVGNVLPYTIMSLQQVRKSERRAFLKSLCSMVMYM